MSVSKINFKIGDRVVDTKHPDYDIRIGTVVEACTERNERYGNIYPAAIKWDDGVTFNYQAKEFDRLRATFCGEVTIKATSHKYCGSEWCRICSG